MNRSNSLGWGIFAALFSLASVEGFVRITPPLSRTLYGAGASDEETTELASYVVVGNLQSGTNIGRIIRSATIFGVKELIVVGHKKFSAFGNHGTRFELKTTHFFRPVDALAYLREEKGATVLGVEIEAGAKPLMSFDRVTGQASFPFRRSTAFVFGNEGEGMSPGFRAICDDFV
jgi:tRNA G18 (ribose-2'-O)-methylase SpoU